MQLSETGELIFAWLKDQYPTAKWSTVSDTKSDTIKCDIPGVMYDTTTSIQFTIAGLVVMAWLGISSMRAVKICSVTLDDPRSIEKIQTLINHIIKVCPSFANMTSER